MGENALCDSLSTQFWAMIMSFGWVFVCVFQCGVRDKRAWMYGQKSNQLKAEATAQKMDCRCCCRRRKIINGKCEWVFFPLVSHTVLFMQLLTTLMATKQLHFNPFRNHFRRLTNNASPVRLHSLSHTGCHMTGRLVFG